MADQKISDLNSGSLGANDYTIIQRGTDNYRFLIRDAIDARIYSLAALSGHGHIVATPSVSGFMSASDKGKLDSIESGATTSGAAGDAYAVSHEADTTAHTAANIVNVPAGNISATTVQAALNELDTEKQPLDASLTALAALTTAADKFIYFTGPDVPVAGTVTSAARSVLDDATTDDMLVTLGGAATEGTGGIVRRLAPTLVSPSVSGSIVLYKAEVAPTNTGAGVIWVEDASPTKLVYKDSTGTDDYVVLLTKSQSLTNKVINGVTLEAGGSTSEFLNRFGTYSTPAGGGSGTLTDGDKGDITVTSSGSVWTIDSGLSATKIADGSVSNTEFQYLDGVTSNIQTQLGNKQPLDATLTALAALTTAADRFIYFTGSDVPVTGIVTSFARSILDDTSGSGVLATLSGISREELSYGGVGVADYNKIPKYNIDGSLAVSNKISIFNPDDTRFVNVKYLSNIGDYNLFIPGTVAEDDAYFVVVPATAQVGDIVYWGGTGVGGIATNGTSGYVLISNGAGSPPTWGQVTGGGGSGVSDGDKGDITVSSAGAVWTIDSGLNASKIANGTISNTEFQYLSGATSNIQTQLENKQPLNVILTALSALTTAADRFIYFTGVNTPVTGEITAFARSILDDVNGNSVLATISGISNEQLSIGGFGASDSGKIPIFTGDGSLNISNTLYIHNGSGSASITYPFPNIHDLVIPNTVSSNSSSLMTLDSVESRYGDLVYWGGVNTGCVSTIGPSGHVLKSNGTGNAPTWGQISGLVAWGDIIGTLSAQTDLQSALAAKASATHTHTASEISDSTAAGRSVLTAATATAIKDILDLERVVNIKIGIGTTAPGVDDDITNGWYEDDIWFDVFGQGIYVCQDPSDGVAEWTRVADVGGSGVSDGDKGDITVSSAGSVWTVDSGLSATKIADGSVSNTEFQYLDGVTSNIQTQLGNKQPLDATLTALAAYNTNGVLVQTSTDTFTGRTITGTSNEITVTNGDGVAGNPTLSLPTGINPTKLADGSVSATEFQYLDGVTSNIQTQFSNKQPLDATLTALASYNTNGLLAQTAADTFAGRTVTAGQGISVSNGDGVAGNPTIALNTNALRGEISFRIDGGGSAITTGAKKFYLRVGYDCTITGWELVADQSGSISIDIWKDSFANFPPTVADTITASAKPSLSTAQKNSSSSLTGWTTSLSAGDYLEVNVDSVSTVTLAILTLLVTRT